MVYNGRKRARTTSDSSIEEDLEYHPYMQANKPPRKPTRVPNCYTRNALMARENRLKKKQYISNLEDEAVSLKRQNKKLSTVVENQSHLIQDLRREIKYLKSVLSNSDGIGKLINNINLSTGMSVTTSLKHNEDSFVTTSLNDNEDSYKPEIARKTAHPWEENTDAGEHTFASLPTPESTISYYSNPEYDDLNTGSLLSDIDMPLDLTDSDLLNLIDAESLDLTVIPTDDHNYHYQPKQENPEEDVGICLHVSNNKVSLEFCQHCSDKAQQMWTAQT